MLLWFALQVWPSTAKLSQKGKKKETLPSILKDHLYFTDTISMGLDSIDADLKRPDDVTDVFYFDKEQSTASRTTESTTSTKYLEILQYESGLHHSKQSSSLKKADTVQFLR